MKFYPEPKEDKDILGLPLQSILFGHRLIKDQTISEYLLEFLQVVLSKKQVIFNEDEYKTSSDFFPIMEKHETLRKIEIFPQINMGLRRFIFFDKSKKDTQAPCDFNAFNLHKELVKQKIYTCCNTENTISKDEILDILQELLYSFSGILSNRSWCAQSLLPICEKIGRAHV